VANVLRVSFCMMFLSLFTNVLVLATCYLFFTVIHVGNTHCTPMHSSHVIFVTLVKHYNVIHVNVFLHS
jgi:hypothetical protein